MMLRALILAASLAIAALAWAGAAPGPSPEGISLDIPADFAPLLCGDRLYVFSSGGRNQMMAPGDKAPNCDPVQFSPAFQPVCGAEGPLVLDKEGALWQLGKGFPVTIQSGLREAIALLPGASGFTVVLKDRLLLAGGNSIALPFQARGAVALGDAGFWIWGEARAARLEATGKVKWPWSPRKGMPGPAVLSGDTLFAGSSRGELYALWDEDGRTRFRYRGGGEVDSPPVVTGGRVVYASLDHFIRSIEVRNGLLAWQSRTSGRPAFGPFLVKGGLLFAESAGSRLYILSPENGQKVWEWRAASGSILQSPAVAGDTAAVLIWGEESTPVLYQVPLPAKAEAPKARADLKNKIGSGKK
jgi:hypothetical protein